VQTPDPHQDNALVNRWYAIYSINAAATSFVVIVGYVIILLRTTLCGSKFWFLIILASLLTASNLFDIMTQVAELQWSTDNSDTG
jgi:hypothetical protein